MRSKAFIIAAAQIAPVFLNKKKTVEKACEAIRSAAEAGARIVLFPETFIPGYPDWIWCVPNNRAKILNELYAELIENSVSVPDKDTDKLCRTAKQAKISIAIGIHERNTDRSGGSLFNSLLFINEKGEIAGIRRKLIPTSAERLLWAQGDGKDLKALELNGLKTGGLICWENLMPLARQALYEKGIQILLSPTWDKSDSWINSMKHIAREGGIYIVSCCSAIRLKDIPDNYEFKSFYPDKREWINPGNSCIINPKGEIIAGPATETEEIIFAEFHPEMISFARRMFDPAGHYSRPDVFEFFVKSNLSLPSK
ncbi:MAG: carbon-nitrogen hydrolase family protein [Ignavibacteriaceae bacterium]